jgi:hypothetical protein
MAIISGAAFGEGGPSLDVNIIGESTSTGLGISPDVSSLVVGGGFKHFSISLDPNKPFLEQPKLDPTDKHFRLEFNIVGGVQETTKEVISIDNVKLTVKKP